MKEHPHGWEETEIGNLFQLINGRAFKPVEWSNSGLPIIRIQNLNNPTKEFNKFEGEFHERHLVDPGDLLFAWSGTPGTSFGAHLWDGEQALLNQHIFRMPPISPKDTNKKFFKNAINRRLAELIGSAQGGVGLRHVTKGVFEKTKVVVPPLNEQKRIVAKLESCESRITAAREALDGVPALLEQYRQSILAAAFRGDLTKDWRAANPNTEPASELLKRLRKERRQRWEEAELAKYDEKGKKPPKNWESRYKEAPFLTREELRNLPLLPTSWCWVRVSEVVSALKYGTSTKSKKKGKIPVLRMGNLQRGRLDWENLVYTSDEQEIEKYILPNPSVLFNRTNSPELVGKTSIYEGNRPAIYAGYLIHVDCLPSYSPYLMNIILNSPQAKTWCRKAKSDGVSQSNISAGKLSTLIIPVCPLQEQTEIVSKANSLLKIIESVNQSSKDLTSSIETLERALLSKAFSGQLVPQDPNDEPASYLLERIKEKRLLEQQIRAKRPKKKRKPTVKMSKPTPATIHEALKGEGVRLSTNELFEKMGHANDSNSEIVEAFLIQLRDAISEGKILKVRENNEDYFSLKSE